MTKMKRMLSVSLAGCMAASAMIMGAGASNLSDSAAQASTQKLAYMDIESAPEALQDDILAARAEIIFGEQAWTVDGAVQLVKADGTIQQLPEFKDLYPDWDIPNIDYSGQATNSTFEYMLNELDPDQPWTIDGAVQAVKADGTVEKLPELSELLGINMDAPARAVSGKVLFNNPVLLKIADDQDSTPFYSFNSTGENIRTTVQTLPGDRCNVGYTNEDTHQSVGWYPNMEKGDSLDLVNPTSGTRYGVRASVYRASDVGIGGLIVYIPN